jgi:hypothetical protein
MSFMSELPEGAKIGMVDVRSGMYGYLDKDNQFHPLGQIGLGEAELADLQEMFKPHGYRPAHESRTLDGKTWFPCIQCGMHPLSDIHPGHTYVASEELGDRDEYEGKTWFPCIYCGKPSWLMEVHPDS